MPEAKRKSSNQVKSDLALDGFENFFDGATEKIDVSESNLEAISLNNGQLEPLLDRFSQLVTFMVDQRVETARINNQLIENQRQLIATQQILIRLMERSIELTRHITGLEEKLPAIFELPRLFETLRVQVAQLERVEID